MEKFLTLTPGGARTLAVCFGLTKDPASSSEKFAGSHTPEPTQSADGPIEIGRVIE